MGERLIITEAKGRLNRTKLRTNPWQLIKVSENFQIGRILEGDNCRGCRFLEINTQPDGTIGYDNIKCRLASNSPVTLYTSSPLAEPLCSDKLAPKKRNRGGRKHNTASVV